MTVLGHFTLSQYFKCHVNASNFQINISGISPEQQRNLPTGSSIWRLSESKLHLPLTDFNSVISDVRGYEMYLLCNCFTSPSGQPAFNVLSHHLSSGACAITSLPASGSCLPLASILGTVSLSVSSLHLRCIKSPFQYYASPYLYSGQKFPKVPNFTQKTNPWPN